MIMPDACVTFLSRLCGGEDCGHHYDVTQYFLSRLCGGEVG